MSPGDAASLSVVLTRSTAAGAGFRLTAPVLVGLACLCALAGVAAVPSAAYSLFQTWHTDDLRSMGLAVPFVCFALILRSWRQIGWRAEGSWWGLLVVAVTSVVLFLQNQTFFTVTLRHAWLLQFPPMQLVAVAYAAGLVLLFGGTPLLRAAWFGVLFMVMVIPVPHTFSSLVDLPLQHASATVARGFAHLLGQKLTEDKLRLMFTPDFGMFIAPGCNGIRGSITLGLAAVVVSYVYRFRPLVYAPVVAGAVLLGYLFNFLRLCLLVVYYKIALPYPWLQQRATGADFLIGGALFLCALTVFFAVANRLRRDPADVLPEAAEPGLGEPGARVPGASDSRGTSSSVPALPVLLRAGALLCLAAIFGMDAYTAHAAQADTMASAPVTLPSQLGSWTLQRAWNDTNPDGSVVYSWGEYAAAGGSGPHVALGVAPTFSAHDVELCHLARGENPVYHGQTVARTQGGDVDLTVASYNNGTRQWVEASTICSGGACHQYSGNSNGIAVVYAQPHRTIPLVGADTRQVPVLLRADSTDATSPDAVVRPALLSQIDAFLSQVNLAQVTAPYARPGR